VLRNETAPRGTLNKVWYDQIIAEVSTPWHLCCSHLP
jgi:hypothetical protein